MGLRKGTLVCDAKSLSLWTCCIAEGVGDFGDLGHFGYVVDADDVRAGKYAGGDRGGGAPDARFGRRGLAVGGERRTEKAFAGGAYQQRKAKPR